ncbi:MAG: hypothetical protein IMZ55_07750 [Acidobacteria bacterium]|nr:hypothetical protein [Acidobacteriota bacterium]
MLTFRRVHKAYRETGALNALVQLYAFLDDRVFLTKGGDLGVVLKLTGVDAECLDHEDRDRVARRFDSALRLCDDHIRLLQYLVKRDHAAIPHTSHPNPAVDQVLQARSEFLATHRAPLSSVDLYLVLLSDRWATDQLSASRFGERGCSTRSLPSQTPSPRHRPSGASMPSSRRLGPTSGPRLRAWSCCSRTACTPRCSRRRTPSGSFDISSTTTRPRRTPSR